MNSEELALCQLAVMVFNDKFSDLDIAYLVTETPDNDFSCIETAAVISQRNRYRRARGSKIVLIGIAGFTHPALDHPDNIQKKLERGGVQSDEIVRINYKDAPTGPKGLHHTGTELAMVARFAIERGCKNVGVIAPPFHQLRSYFHALTAVRRMGVEHQVKIFNCPGLWLDWTAMAIHSQGEQKDFRYNILREEIDKVLKYWREGHIISPLDALECFVYHRS